MSPQGISNFCKKEIIFCIPQISANKFMRIYFPACCTTNQKSSSVAGGSAVSGAAATVGARSTPRAEALWRYLGVGGDSDPREVLGIRGAVLSEGRIEAAAQRRWRQVAQHPAAGEPAAHFARSAIVQAAETLLGRVPGRRQ